MTALSLTVEDGIAVVVFDLPDAPLNIISRTVKNEFIALFQRLDTTKDAHVTSPASRLSMRPAAAAPVAPATRPPQREPNK